QTLANGLKITTSTGKKLQITNAAKPPPSVAKWVCPPPRMLKINVDAHNAGGGSAGLGAVIRDAAVVGGECSPAPVAAAAFVSIPCLRTRGWENLLETARSRFVEWVNLVLCLHKAPTIDEFKVCLNFEIGSSDVVDSWIKFALEKHAKRLILDLGYGCFNTHPKYALRAQLFSNCNLSCLTTLHLKSIVVTGEVLGYMLSCFPLLQVLHLHGLLSLVELKIAGPSPSLRCLVIKDCWFMRYLEVHAVNLKSFGYCGPNILKYFKEVPCLVEADVDEVFLVKNICQFSSCFSLLESLSLHLPPQRLKWMHEYFPKLPKFNKLRWLKFSTALDNVDGCLSQCTKLLKASPSLQRFVLKLKVFGKINSDIKIRRRKTIYQHKQLKVIEFIGFRGCAKYAKLVQRLLAKLPSLEKVVVDPQPVLPVHKGYGEWDLEKTIATAQLLHK
uniref:At1g61320/AtMIF1 LRR domain-containing protein n=1 Tax=Chenopodium quinoa TaxID=63459 RepID=A0A803MSV6_CHEQI